MPSNTPETQADKDLYSVILNLPETNRKRRLAGEPIIECVQLLAAHRISHSLPGAVDTDDLLDLIDEAIGESGDEEWTPRDAARHVVGALEHAGLVVTPRAALTPSALSGDAGEALAWLERNEHCQLSHGPDFDDDSPEWQVHAVNGGRSDREWKLIGSGATIVEAINAARAKEAAR